MREILEEVLRSIAVYSVPFGIVCYLVKILIVHFLDKDISAYRKSLENDAASFKQSLENTANLELEKYKSQLDKERLRLQISYGGIFEKQANAILEISKALKDLEYSAIKFINSDPNKADESSQLFFQSWTVTNESYSNNRILLPEQLDTDLHKFILDYLMSIHHYTNAKEDLKHISKIPSVSDEELDWIREQKNTAKAMIDSDIPKLKESIISYMRKTLGVVH